MVNVVYIDDEDKILHEWCEYMLIFYVTDLTSTMQILILMNNDHADIDNIIMTW